MNPDVLADIQRRLKNLEDTSVRYRAGEVTGINPLDVALGGSSTSYEDVRAIALGGGSVGQIVAALVFGNDLLVLGPITDTPLRVVYGVVDSAGNEVEGTGYTVAGPSSSEYTITFSPAFSDVPAINPTADQTAGNRQAKLKDSVAATASTVVVRTFNPTTGSASDSGFHFIAVGPA